MQLQSLFINQSLTEVRVELADRSMDRLIGWMGKKDIPREGLLLVPCNGIHTFFVRFPIDAVFLDKRNTVIRIFQALQPWRIIPVVPSARGVLELPAGMAEGLHLKPGDHLSFRTLQKQ